MVERQNKAILFISRHIILLIAFAALFAYAFVYINKYSTVPIRSDGEGYYAYLPSYLIYRDPTMKRVAGIEYKQGSHLFGMHRMPATGFYLDKYPIGEAILLLPFFLAGHCLSLIFGYPANGYSFFYQYSAGLAGLFYMVLGLFFLKKTLKRHFSDTITLITLFTTVFATNLFHYGTYDSIFSHAFSFFLFSVFIFLIPGWYKNPSSYKKTVLLGITSGLIALVRIPDGLVLLFLPLWGINGSGIKERFAFFIRNIRHLVLLCAVAMLVFLPQLFIWKYATNKWLIMPYVHEWFDFLSPHVFDVLFSVRKGLFFWSPILFFAVAGLWYLRRNAREFFIPIVIYLPLNLYIISSWHIWWYGGSFGHRAFVESYALLALPMAAFYDTVLNSWRRPGKYAVMALTVFFTALSLLTMVQYWRGEIPYDKTTWDMYAKAVFMSNTFNPALPDKGYRATISFPYKKIVTRRKTFQLPVTLKNSSPCDWPKDISKTGRYTINMSYRWLSDARRPISGFDPRIPLPHDLHPGESVHFNLSIPVHYKPGTYFLEFDMVQENVTWFRHRGSSTSIIKIVVQ